MATTGLAVLGATCGILGVSACLINFIFGVCVGGLLSAGG